MKRVQTSLALLALFALMLPCAHANEHHHDELSGTGICASGHTNCHSCSSEPCSKPHLLVQVHPASSLEIPVRHIQLFTVLETIRPFFVAASRPAGDLLLLQTVQLLI